MCVLEGGVQQQQQQQEDQQQQQQHNIQNNRKFKAITPMELLSISQEEKILRYQCFKTLGSGAFGEVKLGIDTHTGDKVALKYVRITTQRDRKGLPKACFREMEALKQLGENCRIVHIKDFYAFETKLVLVLEYLPSDMATLISQLTDYLPRSHLKSYSFMIFDGLDYCHSNNIIHRDIKPSNILISSSGNIKLADFGLARVYNAASDVSMSHQIMTRWYRSPELLFASR